MIHLDTSFVVDLLREARKQPGLASQLLDSIRGEEVVVSVFVLCELYAGAELARDPVQEKRAVEHLCGGLNVRIPDQKVALVYGQLLATLQKAGKSIATMDLLIAAAALLDHAPLVTRNLGHFNRVPGLAVRSY